MSQQINLLGKERMALSPALVAVSVWLLILVGIASVWSINQFRLSVAREAERVASSELSEARTLIKKREDTQAALKAEIAQLRPVAAAAQQFLLLAEALGSTQGYVPLFTTLANAVEDGLWLVGVNIKNSGKSLRIEGQSLSNDLVLRYGQRLNTDLADQGIRFANLEMASQTVGVPGPDKSTLNATRFVLVQ